MAAAVAPGRPGRASAGLSWPPGGMSCWLRRSVTAKKKKGILLSYKFLLFMTEKVGVLCYVDADKGVGVPATRKLLIEVLAPAETVDVDQSNATAAAGVIKRAKHIGYAKEDGKALCCCRGKGLASCSILVVEYEAVSLITLALTLSILNAANVHADRQGKRANCCNCVIFFMQFATLALKSDAQ